MPGLALPFTPVTVAFGPVFAYDVACILMPALSAWTAFLLCRYVTGRMLPSLAGGYLFGFSSYVLSAELSHIHTAAVFLLPLAALLVLRFLRGDTSAGRFIVWFGLLLAWQATLSTEVLLMLTLALAVSLAAAALLVTGVRGGLRRLLVPLVAGYALGAAAVSPLAYFVVTSSEKTPDPGASAFRGDLLNFVVPTRASFGGWWSSGLASHFPGNDIERGAYLGVPLLAVLAWYGLANRRRPSARLLLVLFLAAAVATLGSKLTVDGHGSVWLPWSLVANRPVFENVMPVRFSVFCALVAALVTALWLAARPRLPAVALLTVAIVAILPNLSWSAWSRQPDVPALFTSGTYRDCIPRDANVIVVPIGPRGDSMIWQAESHFWFRMAGGYITPVVPAGFDAPAIRHVTSSDRSSEITAAAVLELARLKSATLVVVDAHVASTWRPILRQLGTPEAVAGTLIYRLDGGVRPARCR